MKTSALFETDPNRDMIISFCTIRRAVGWLGIALPVVCYLGTLLLGNCDVLKASISDYYYTIMGTTLVGILCAVALFLLTYKGPAPIDGILSSLAALFALGVAFCPCNVTGGHYDCNVICFPAANDTRDTFHYCFAAGLFCVQAVMCFWLFTRTNKTDPKPPKKARNRVYYICGAIMVVAIALILLLKIFQLGTKLYYLRPVYWLELITLWAFGVAWLVKGQIVLKDKPEDSADA